MINYMIPRHNLFRFGKKDLGGSIMDLVSDSKQIFISVFWWGSNKWRYIFGFFGYKQIFKTIRTLKRFLFRNFGHTSCGGDYTRHACPIGEHRNILRQAAIKTLSSEVLNSRNVYRWRRGLNEVIARYSVRVIWMPGNCDRVTVGWLNYPGMAVPSDFQRICNSRCHLKN